MSCEGPSSVNRGILEKIIHKVPGIPIQTKREKQGFVILAEKSKNDLLELIERQNKLLKNKAFLDKLPDKGEKILLYKKQLEEELKNREKSEHLSDMLLKLNINGKAALDKLEWTGNCNPGRSKFDEITCDNDFDTEESDPLKIIANHSGTGFHKKINRILPPEPCLIKPSDIEEFEGKNKKTCLSEPSGHASEMKFMDDCGEKEAEPIIEEPYIKNLCCKFDKLHGNTEIKKKFLPHKTVNRRTVEEILNKHKEKTKLRNWEVTAATPPPPVFNDTKLLPLEESVKLQIQQAEKLKEVQMKHATEKLKSLTGRDIGYKESDNWIKNQFRDVQKHYDTDSSGEEGEDDDKQSFLSCHDDDDAEDADEKRGGITFYNLIDN